MFGLIAKLRAYWKLIKSLQTALLLLTGLAGYMSARCPVTTWQTLFALAASLFLTIGGSTVLNMVYDRDIDAKMQRSCRRPLPAGEVSCGEALALGVVLVAAGIGWAMLLSPVYGAIVFAGMFFDVIVYTIWLKRRTAFSVLIGGLSGAMPVLAGRGLATGSIDGIGVLLGLAILLWIPAHIMTFSVKYSQDYARARVPTFPTRYGVPATRVVITLSSLGAAAAVTAAAIGLGMAGRYLQILGLLSGGLLALAVISLWRPSDRLNFGLFKYASVYMLGSMLLVALGTA